MKKIIFAILLMLLPFGVQAQLNTERLTSIGRNALYFEDYVLSIQYFNQVIKSKPFLSEAYFYRAIAKIQLEDFVGAKRDLNKVIELNPFIPMAYYARGFARRRLMDFEGATRDFTKALEYSPENPLYIINRIEVYEQLKMYDESIKDIDFLIRRSPNDPGLYLEKGRALLSKGDTLGAKPMFCRGVEIDSLDAELWGAKAYYMMVVDEKDSALVSYDKSVEYGSKNISTYINRGVLNYFKKKYRTALDDYDVAVKLDPYNKQALYNRALLRSEVGDYNTALSDLENILKLDPNFSEAIYHQAVIHIELREWNKAIDELTRLIAKHKYFAPALQLRAQAYDKLGKETLAYADRKAAYDLKEEYAKNKSRDTLNTDVQISNGYNSTISNKSTNFLANVDDDDDQKIRGTVQNSNFKVTNEDNFQLSYYDFRSDELPRKVHINRVVQELNDSKRLSAPIHIVNKEVSLSTSLINYHFASISNYSKQILMQPTNGDLYLARAIEFSLVKDFSSAIDDLSKAIFYGDDMILAYFMRANIRYKSIEVAQNTLDLATNVNLGSTVQKNKVGNIKLQSLYEENKHYMEYEMVMRDYDKVIELAPEFPYAWFNKANLLSLQRDYKASLVHYNEAISVYPDFGEAYYNRAMVYILMNKIDEAILDLSKAGELGIFQSYSIIKRLRK